MSCRVTSVLPFSLFSPLPQDGLLFDNILVSDDVQQAAELRQSRWQSKLDVEKAADKERTEKEEEEERKRKQASGGAGFKNQVLVRRESRGGRCRGMDEGGAGDREGGMDGGILGDSFDWKVF